MRTSLSIVARRAVVLVSSQKALAKTFVKAFSSSKEGSPTTKIPYDGHLNPSQMNVLNHMFDKVGNIETEVAQLKKSMAHMKKMYGVDAPDGESDGELKEDMAQVNEIIDDAAAHEDKDKILKRQKLQEEVKKYHDRDPEHDW